MKYIKLFKTENNYNNWLNSDKFITPYISKNKYNNSIVYQKRLPKYYDSQIEYLESTGTQYIDTKYIPTGDDIKIEGKFYLGSYTSIYGAWFAAYSGEDAEGYRIIRYENSNDTICYNCGAKTQVSGLARALTYTIYNYELTIDKLILNNDTIIHDRRELTNVKNTANLCLFARSDGERKVIGRHYYFKIYKNNILILDLIPVRIGNIGYMYDKISNKIFENQGTGDFILGPDI